MSSAANVVKKAFARLPTSIKPTKYHLRLKPDLAKFTFQAVMSDLATSTEAPRLFQPKLPSQGFLEGQGFGVGSPGEGSFARNLARH